MAELDRFSLHPGAAAPEFDLPGVDGRTHKLHDFDASPFLLVAFWCNHCPYVQGWERRMIAIGHEYAPKGVQVVLINPNDEVAYPDDRMEMMVARAKAQGYPFPYLRDESQAVAHAYGALVTPHPMLFDRNRRLLYQGRIDDRHDDPEGVKHRYLREALDQAVAGRPIVPAERAVQGCSVKWRS